MQRADMTRRNEASRLYQDEGLTIAGTAHRVGVTPARITMWMEGLGVIRRCSSCQIILDKTEQDLCVVCEGIAKGTSSWVLRLPLGAANEPVPVNLAEALGIN
jgi:hypothetical protein